MFHLLILFNPLCTLFFFFFFQAEDGIRDLTVTGVQTCALPIYLVNIVLHWAVETQHIYNGLADPATLPLLLALMGAFGLIVMPIGNGLSRAIEIGRASCRERV